MNTAALMTTQRNHQNRYCQSVFKTCSKLFHNIAKCWSVGCKVTEGTTDRLYPTATNGLDIYWLHQIVQGLWLGFPIMSGGWYCINWLAVSCNHPETWTSWNSDFHRFLTLGQRQPNNMYLYAWSVRIGKAIESWTTKLHSKHNTYMHVYSNHQCTSISVRMCQDIDAIHYAIDTKWGSHGSVWLFCFCAEATTLEILQRHSNSIKNLPEWLLPELKELTMQQFFCFHCDRKSGLVLTWEEK